MKRIITYTILLSILFGAIIVSYLNTNSTYKHKKNVNKIIKQDTIFQTYKNMVFLVKPQNSLSPKAVSVDNKLEDMGAWLGDIEIRNGEFFVCINLYRKTDTITGTSSEIEFNGIKGKIDGNAIRFDLKVPENVKGYGTFDGIIEDGSIIGLLNAYINNKELKGNLRLVRLTEDQVNKLNNNCNNIIDILNNNKVSIAEAIDMFAANKKEIDKLNNYFKKYNIDENNWVFRGIRQCIDKFTDKDNITLEQSVDKYTEKCIIKAIESNIGVSSRNGEYRTLSFPIIL